MKNRVTLGGIPLWVLAVTFVLVTMCTTASFADVPAAVATSANSTHHTDRWPAIATLITLFCAAHFLGRGLKRVGQSPVLAYLALGVAIRNIPGISWVSEVELIQNVGFIGGLLLFFIIGLESEVEKMKKAGPAASTMAVIGLAVQSILVFGVFVWASPGLKPAAYIWFALALGATSAGISSMALKDMKFLDKKVGSLVVSAALIDDFLTFIILTVMASLASPSGGDLVFKLGLVVAFILVAIIGGKWSADKLSRLVSTWLPDKTGQLVFTIGFGAMFAGLAWLCGLDPMIGSFAGGLFLDPAHYEYFNGGNQVHHSHAEELVKPLGDIATPVFFTLAGTNVPLSAFNGQTIGIIVVVTIAALLGKQAAGLGASKALSTKGWLAAGAAMMPRGEVTIVFAKMALTTMAFSQREFSILLGVLLLTDIIGPVLMKLYLNGYREDERTSVTQTEPATVAT